MLELLLKISLGLLAGYLLAIVESVSIFGFHYTCNEILFTVGVLIGTVYAVVFSHAVVDVAGGQFVDIELARTNVGHDLSL